MSYFVKARKAMTVAFMCFTTAAGAASFNFTQTPEQVFEIIFTDIAHGGVRVRDGLGVVMGETGFPGSVETQPTIAVVRDGAVSREVELRDLIARDAAITAAEVIGDNLVAAVFDGSMTEFKIVDTSGPKVVLRPYAGLGPRAAKVIALNTDGSFAEVRNDGGFRSRDEMFFITASGAEKSLGTEVGVQTSEGWLSVRTSSRTDLFRVENDSLVNVDILSGGSNTNIITSVHDGVFAGETRGFSGDALIVDCRGATCVENVFAGPFASAGLASPEGMFFFSQDFASSDHRRTDHDFDFATGDPFVDGEQVFAQLGRIFGVAGDPIGNFSIGCGFLVGTSSRTSCQFNGVQPTVAPVPVGPALPMLAAALAMTGLLRVSRRA